MNITDENTFKLKKTEILEKIIPHLMKPAEFPMPRLSLDDCALLTAKSLKDVRSRTSMRKIETCAMAKMRQGLAEIGITSVGDLTSFV